MNANTEVEATTHLQKVLNLGEQLNLSLKKEKCEPFMHFPDSYEIELESPMTSEKQLIELLEGIAPKWNQLPTGMIATKQENHLLIDHLEMIEVYPEF